MDALSLDEIQEMFQEETQRRESCQFKGVTQRGTKWQAAIAIPAVKGIRRQKTISFGLYEDERSAACIYDAAAWEVWGRCEAKER